MMSNGEQVLPGLHSLEMKQAIRASHKLLLLLIRRAERGFDTAKWLPTKMNAHLAGLSGRDQIKREQRRCLLQSVWVPARVENRLPLCTHGEGCLHSSGIARRRSQKQEVIGFLRRGQANR